MIILDGTLVSCKSHITVHVLYSYFVCHSSKFILPKPQEIHFVLDCNDYILNKTAYPIHRHILDRGISQIDRGIYPVLDVS